MRIAVIGPQNTGKSTFIKDFLEVFPDFITPGQNYRDVVQEKGLEINQKTTEESQRFIREFLLTQALENKNPKVLFDRCVVDNYIYTRAQFERGIIDESFLRETEKVMYASLDHLDALIFIPTAVSVKLVDDAVRDTDTMFVDQINCLFIETLFNIAQRSMIKIIPITGTREGRIAHVQKSLKL